MEKTRKLSAFGLPKQTKLSKFHGKENKPVDHSIKQTKLNSSNSHTPPIQVQNSPILVLEEERITTESIVCSPALLSEAFVSPLKPRPKQQNSSLSKQIGDRYKNIPEYLWDVHPKFKTRPTKQYDYKGTLYTLESIPTHRCLKRSFGYAKYNGNSIGNESTEFDDPIPILSETDTISSIEDIDLGEDFLVETEFKSPIVQHWRQDSLSQSTIRMSQRKKPMGLKLLSSDPELVILDEEEGDFMTKDLFPRQQISTKGRTTGSSLVDDIVQQLKFQPKESELSPKPSISEFDVHYSELQLFDSEIPSPIVRDKGKQNMYPKSYSRKYDISSPIDVFSGYGIGDQLHAVEDIQSSSQSSACSGFVNLNKVKADQSYQNFFNQFEASTKRKPKIVSEGTKSTNSKGKPYRSKFYYANKKRKSNK